MPDNRVMYALVPVTSSRTAAAGIRRGSTVARYRTSTSTVPAELLVADRASKWPRPAPTPNGGVDEGVAHGEWHPGAGVAPQNTRA